MAFGKKIVIDVTFYVISWMLINFFMFYYGISFDSDGFWVVQTIFYVSGLSPVKTEFKLGNSEVWLYDNFVLSVSVYNVIYSLCLKRLFYGVY